jgi:hypothetical protein
MARTKPVAQTAFVSASRAASTYYSQELDNSIGGFALTAIVDVTVPNGGSLVVTLQGYDFTSGKWYDLIASASITTASTTPLLTYPGASIVANSVGQWPVPSRFRVKAVTATAAVTFSVGLELTPA